MWVIDAFNVLGARPDGWWRRRALALAELCDTIAEWRPEAEDVVVMIDGFPKAEVPPGRRRGLEVRYARRRGPDGADRAIVELVEDTDDSSSLVVVTSDVALREAVTELGARTEPAGWFRTRLEEAARRQ